MPFTLPFFLTVFAPCAVQAASPGVTQQYNDYMACSANGNSTQTLTQVACLQLARDNGHRYYSYGHASTYGAAGCVTTETCDDPITYTPDPDDAQLDRWRIKLMDCSTRNGEGLSTCDDENLSDAQRIACALSTSYPCACGSAACTTNQTCTNNTSTCDSPCDASSAPANGSVGTCTNVLASGTTCQPTCASGYTASGPTECKAGVLVAATCIANSCNTTAPPDGALGDCPASLASGETCQPTCNSGYTVSGSRTVSGTSSCFAGELSSATCDTCCCPINRRIANEADCRATIDALGVLESGYDEYVNSSTSSWTYKNGWLLQIPGGCSYSTGTEAGMHFEGGSDNTEPGQAYSGFVPVCKQCTSFSIESTCKQASCAWSSGACVECSTFSNDACLTVDQCSWSDTEGLCQPAYVITSGSMATRQRNPCESVGLIRLGSTDECVEAGDVLALDDVNGASISGIASSNIVQYGCIWKDNLNLKWNEDCDDDDQAAQDSYAAICKVTGSYVESGTCPYGANISNWRYFSSASPYGSTTSLAQVQALNSKPQQSKKQGLALKQAQAPQRPASPTLRKKRFLDSSAFDGLSPLSLMQLSMELASADLDAEGNTDLKDEL